MTEQINIIMVNEYIKWVLEAVKEELDYEPDFVMDDLVATLYNSELNYNNADKTSGQRVFTEQELESEIETTLNYLKQDSDRCSGCGKIITDEEYVVDYEDRGEYWGAPCKERVVTGYKCSSCGEQENY